MTATLQAATMDGVASKKRSASSPELEAAKELVRQAREQGLSLTGPDGLLEQLTKTVLETALNEELTEHLGYDKHDPAGQGSGNIRNGINARVPTVEYALVIKALSYGSRMMARDAVDIHRLLEIANAYPPDEIGGWQLRNGPLHGSRRDAASQLHELARQTRRDRNVGDGDLPSTRLAALIAALIGQPG